MPTYKKTALTDWAAFRDIVNKNVRARMLNHMQKATSGDYTEYADAVMYVLSETLGGNIPPAMGEEVRALLILIKDALDSDTHRELDLLRHELEMIKQEHEVELSGRSTVERETVNALQAAREAKERSKAAERTL